jgi:processive 1,2-diacylglycerol beta-glucosyltransferase
MTHARQLLEAAMAQRVLVLSASVGAGHLRAAEAVELALKQLDPEAVVKNVDVLEMTNRTFRQFYGKAYLDLANRAPHLLGFFYDLLDRPGKRKQQSDRLRLAIEKLNFRKFRKALEKEPWDIIVNTHFLPAEIIAHLREKGKIETAQFTVTTDFETHRLWVNQPCEHYFTATAEAARYLEHLGVPPADVTVSGIPIHPVFSQAKNRGQTLEKHGLVGDRPILLQMAGGFGVGPVAKLFRAILSIEEPLQVVVAAGMNAKLKAELDALEKPERHRVTVLGFTTAMDELMSVADVVVSKPGGLTTSEVLASGAVLAVVNPIPGQESRNSDFLLENGAAIKINNVATLPFKLTELLKDRPRLASLKAQARKLGRPEAAFEVGRAALAWPNERPPAST